MIYESLMKFSLVKLLILKLPRIIKRGIVMFLDVMLAGLTVWIAFGLRMDQWSFLQGSQWWAFFVAASIALPFFIFSGLYRAIFRYVGSVALTSIFKVFIFYSILYFVIFSLVGVQDIPRSIGVTQPILFFIGVCLSRFLIRYWLGEGNNFLIGFNRKRPNILIYGAGLAGRQLAVALLVKKDVVIKGFVDDDPNLQGNTINGLGVFAGDDLECLIQRLKITDVLLALPSVSQHFRSKIIASLSECNVRVRTVPDLIDVATGGIKISDVQELDMDDLLGRESVTPDIAILQSNILNKKVLVTGAGGSIGSELCRMIIKFSPQSLILVDSNEHSLYLIYEELNALLNRLDDQNRKGFLGAVSSSSCVSKPPVLSPQLASVRDFDLMTKIISAHQPHSVFHAAAYKHVPMVEQNPVEGIRNNVLGTLVCAKVCIEHDVRNFTLISTDKAVRPTNIMGASKRIAELVLQGLSESAEGKANKTCFSIVRFGNVLGSSGSVAPLFSAQIKKGGPITLTHPEVTRYFMTIREAAQLVVQASSMATGGDVFVLDMGEPVRIYDLAKKMIYLSGFTLRDELHPDGDIEIKVTGLRPGEKLYEELLIGDSPVATQHPKIMKAHEEFLSWADLELELEKLNIVLQANDHNLLRITLKKLVPGYLPNSNGLNL